MISPFLLPLTALCAGFVLGVVVHHFRARAGRAALREQAASAALEGESLRTAVEDLRIRDARLEAQLAAERVASQQLLAAERTAAAERLDSERLVAGERLALLTAARSELANQFKALAGEIFEERARRFGEQNQQGMESLLGPLKEKLGEFQTRVEGLQQEGLVGRAELRTHIETLSRLNDRLSSEAAGLASALKGSSKVQGDWGEVLLERMLEDAGLRRGEEYRVQESFTREDGTRARPDVVVNLPAFNGTPRHIVIDAKVSLGDYNAYCESSEEAARAVLLTKHVASLREHLRGLSKRKYHALYELQSIDFVVLFVPIEPAYLLALQKDGRLWQEAWEGDVLLVSPGTLFPVIRTIAQLWRQEQQNRNVQEIVYRGGELYDKLAAFAADLVKVGDGLDTARESYDRALNKLRMGRGNAIRQAEMLKSLGVKPSKSMPKEMLEALEDEAESATLSGTVAEPPSAGLFDRVS